MAKLGKRALVIGGGMGGLSAAAAAAPFFETVTLVDKDSVRAAHGPRMGVGQGGHAHLLLGAGAGALERVMPGMGEAMAKAGAAKVRVTADLDSYDSMGEVPKCDAGFSVSCLSRPAYERTLRAAVLSRGNVEILDEEAVDRLLVVNGDCTGAALSDGRTLEADLVIDATGMHGPLAQRLAEDGEAAFETESVQINVSYTSARFERPSAFKGEQRAFYVLPGWPNTAFAILMPVEDDGWMVSLGSRGPTSVPRDLSGYLDFARALPTPWIHERLADAKPASEIRTFRKIHATRRRFGAAARWPGRLIPIGDAMTSFNPTFGQGMTVAAVQAAALSAALAARSDLQGLAADYFPAAEAVAGAAWGMAIANDYTYGTTVGERPADFAQSQAVSRILRRFAEEDEEFMVARQKVFHLLESPAILQRGALGERVGAAIQRGLSQPA